MLKFKSIAVSILSVKSPPKIKDLNLDYLIEICKVVCLW